MKWYERGPLYIEPPSWVLILMMTVALAIGFLLGLWVIGLMLP